MRIPITMSHGTTRGPLFMPEELKLLGLLADYVREHDGLAPWG